MLSAVSEQRGSEMPTMVRTVWQQRDEFWYLSAGGRESCFICVAGACVPNPRTPVNDFPGSAAFFCLRKMWRWAITLITDHLSTGFHFRRFLLFGSLVDRPSFILGCSAGIKITSTNVHFFFSIFARITKDKFLRGLGNVIVSPPWPSR